MDIRRKLNTEKFIEEAKKVHGKIYDYSLSEYTKCLNKVTVICNKHGEFYPIVNNHLRGSGCPKCGFIIMGKKKKGNTFNFIEKSIKIHGNKYDYSKSNFIGILEPISIICKIHGEFSQVPNTHLRGSGCPLCANESQNSWSVNSWISASKSSNSFDGFKLYIIKCFNDNEVFYKVGKTFKTIKKRFAGKRAMPYNYELFYLIEGDADFINKLESEVKRKNSHLKYKPNNEFKGLNECFSKIECYGN